MRLLTRLLILCPILLTLAGCSSPANGASTQPTTGGSKLRVVATTSIVGDVVKQIGGESIDLTVLIKPGQDPHSYEPAADDIARVEKAQVVFTNGFDLEQSLIPVLDAQVYRTRIISVSDGLRDLIETGESEHSGIDPHVWQDPANVEVWADNIAAALGAYDPANANRYGQNAAAYKHQLGDLNAEIAAQVETIPADRRKLVTNHDTLAYFARRYGFKVIGTVYIGASEVAEPSAGAMADLVTTIKAENVRAIFVETTVSDQLAKVVTQEVGEDVKALTLYTDSLGAPGSGADTYLGMMRANTRLIVEGLRG